MPVARLAVRLAVLSCFAASASALGASPSPATAPGGVEDPIAALAAPDPRTRALAAETLGRSRDRAAVQPLIALLADPDLVVRKYAARSLGAIGDAAAAEPLIRALGSYGPEREAAAVALGQIGDRRAVAPLYVTFGDPEEGVRHAAAASLSSLGEPGASLLEQGLAGSRDAIAQLVAEDDGRLLARVLASFDKWHPACREGVVWAVGGAKDARTIPFFVHAVSDPVSTIRTAAVWCIGRIKPAAAVGVLTRALTDEFYGVREAAAWALGQSGDPAAVASLVRALGDPAPAVREAAAWGLKKTADPAVAAPLANALDDRDEKVRVAAVYALGQHRSAPIVERLASVLTTDTSPAVRAAAASSLSSMGTAEAVDPLLGSLRDLSPTVRVAASTGLGDVADPRAPGALIEAIADRDDAVRAAAAASLSKLHEPLGQLLLERVRGNHASKEVLEARGGTASPAALEALRSSSQVVRLTAAAYLGEVGDPRATDALAALSSSWNPADRVAGMASLVELRGRGVLAQLSTAARILCAGSTVAYYAALTALFALLLSLASAVRRSLPIRTRVGAASLLAGLALSLPAASPTWIYLSLVLVGAAPFALIRVATSRRAGA